ncbi:MAG: triose-phosphate isomerase [Dehalococcoidia bacterium]
MRTPIIAGNWKMNATVEEAVSLVGNIKERLDAVSGVEKVVCPPFVSLAPVADALRGSSIEVGAQNMYFEDKGAFTGEVSPTMLAGICRYVILGHSERRGYFGETDEMVNRKIKAAFSHNLNPIVCIGETLEEQEAGKTEEVVTRQAKAALEGLDDIGKLIIAYEPIWAIGTGKSATEAEANGTIGLIRQVIEEAFAQGAQTLRILYGGSANASNIGAFMSQPEIDGALVGGASLKADEFIGMVEQAAKVKDQG